MKQVVDPKCRSYMIEPSLFNSATGYCDKPTISSSLSTTLKASVTMIHHDDSPEIQVHLYDRYGYSLLGMSGVWQMLDLATSFPPFESVSDVEIYIHASPRVGAMQQLRGLLDTSLESDIEEERDDEEEDSDSALAEMDILFTPPVAPWLEGVLLNIDKSIKLEVDDYIILSKHNMILLRSYAVMRRAEGDATMTPPQINMSASHADVLLGFTAAVRLFLLLVKRC